MLTARDELLRHYNAILRREFSCLVNQSIEALEHKLIDPDKKEKFIKDLKRRYRIRENYAEIDEMLDAICDQEDLGLDNYQALFCILVDYVDNETLKLRTMYENVVAAWKEVKAYFERSNDPDYINSHTLQVRYKVPPADVKNASDDICKMFELPSLKILLLYNERDGSILLTWVINIANAVTRDLLQRNVSANSQILNEKSISHVIYNFEVLYPVSFLTLT